MDPAKADELLNISLADEEDDVIVTSAAPASPPAAAKPAAAASAPTGAAAAAGAAQTEADGAKEAPLPTSKKLAQTLSSRDSAAAAVIASAAGDGSGDNNSAKGSGSGGDTAAAAAGAAAAEGNDGPADAAAEAGSASAPRPLAGSLAALKSGTLQLAGIVKAAAEKTASALPAMPAVKVPSIIGGGGGGSGTGSDAAAAADANGGNAAGSTTAAPGEGGDTAAAASTAAAAAAATAAAALSRFRVAGSRLAHSATDGLKWLAAGDGPLLALCRAEPSMPQWALVCCAALVAGEGVRTRGILKAPAPTDAVERLKHAGPGGRPCVIPPGTDPHVVGELLKRFLRGLPEPLLTYRLLPDWVCAAGDPDKAHALVAQLPAANANVLRVLRETCHWIAHNAADTEMDAQALAEVLAPCVAWLPPSMRPARTASGGVATATGGAAVAAAAAGGSPTATGGGSGGASDEQQQQQQQPSGGGVPLEGDELAAIVVVLENLINRFALTYG